MTTEAEFYIEDLKTKFAKINFEDYYLSYSGGKDSHLLYWFIKNILRDDKIKIVSTNTRMEHHEIRKRMYKNADVAMLPTMKHYEIKETYGIPCFSKFQDEIIRRYQRGSRAPYTMGIINGTILINGQKWTRFKLNDLAKELTLSGKLHKVSPKCCDCLKKNPLKQYGKESNRITITGVRKKEGIMRGNISSCFANDMTFRPLFDLTTEVADQIYKQFGIKVPKIYDSIDRTGCMGCPYAPKKNIEAEIQRLGTAQRNFVVNYFKESYDVKQIDY